MPEQTSTSPFPGMDPFLEGHLWPDVHHDLASAIRELLAPLIAPKYVARVEPYTVEDTAPESEVGIMYPDVAVLQQRELKEPAATYPPVEGVTAPNFITAVAVTVRVPVIQIIDTARNRLVACIEILSPVNKRDPGWQPYHEKRLELHRAGVHLLEIDLLRRGKRHVPNLGLPEHHYLCSLWRAGADRLEVWTMRMQQALPVLPVPLLSPDPDVPLPLKTALDMVYRRGLYQLSIDYGKTPPPPELSASDLSWLRGVLEPMR